jgi:hypothetical protein
MPFSPDLSESIQAAIKDFAANPKRFRGDFEDAAYLGEAALRLNALPAFYDMGGFYAIRPDGNVLVVSWDDPEDVQVELDERVHNIVFLHASREYDQLRELEPTRPPGALQCAQCGGTGISKIVSELGLEPGKILCFCGGSGWIPDNYTLNHE